MICKSILLIWILASPYVLCQEEIFRADTREGEILEYPDVYVEAFYTLESTTPDGKWSVYDFTVDVRNTGNKTAQEVSLVAEMLFDRTKVAYVESSGSINDRREDPTTVNNSYLWPLGSMASILSEPESKRTVSLKINSSEPISQSIQFYVQYRIGSKPISTIAVKPIGEETFGEV